MSETESEATWAQQLEQRVEAIEAHVGLGKSDDEHAGDAGDETTGGNA